jgi:hypothetical protein
MSDVLYSSKFRFHIEEWVQIVHYLLIFEDFWTKVSLKVLFKFPVFEKILIVFVEICFIFTGYFTTEIFKILHICYPQ